jgi:hypothetical protein
LDAVAVDVAIESGAAGCDVVVDGEIYLEDAVLAAEVFGFGDLAADGGARAWVFGELLGAERRT